MVNFSFTYPTTKEVIDKGNNGEFGRLQLRSVGDGEKLYKVAADSYLRMKRAAKKDGVNIKLNDGYRRCGEKGDYNENKSNGEFTQWYAWEPVSILYRCAACLSNSKRIPQIRRPRWLTPVRLPSLCTGLLSPASCF